MRLSGFIPTPADTVQIKVLAAAFRYQSMRGEGQCAAITETAETKRLNHGYVGLQLSQELLR